MNINSNYRDNQERNYAGMAGQKVDSFSKGIQNQIANAQKQLQNLSSREDMSPEEKMKKRQEIQKQIYDLNNQLRQHQIEQRNEKQKGKDSLAEVTGRQTKRTGKKTASGAKTGISQAGMEALISADHAMDQARVQKSVATDLEGKARILKSEIRQDASLGGDTSDKEKVLEKLENAAANVTAAQLQTLGETEEKMNEEAEDEPVNELVKEKKGLEEKEEETDSTERKSVDVRV